MTEADLKALRWAVRETAAWRGLYTGHPDAAADLAAFDAQIARCKQALRNATIAVRGRRPRTNEPKNRSGK